MTRFGDPQMSQETEITTLSQALYVASKRLGWRKRRMAEELNISTRTLHRWESGDSSPRGQEQRAKVAAVLARALSPSRISELLGVKTATPAPDIQERLGTDRDEVTVSLQSERSVAFREALSPKGITLAYQRLNASLQGKQLNYCDLIGYQRYQSPEERDKLSHLLLRGEFTPTRPPKFYEVKKTYLQRTITVLSARDELVYQAIANHIAARAYSKLRSNRELSFAHQLTPGVERGLEVVDEPSGVEPLLAPWFPSWDRFRQKTLEMSEVEGTRYVIELDVASFYDNINHKTLMTVLERDFEIDRDLLSLLESCLNCWSGVRDETQPNDGATPGLGIPQGSQASNLLAELYLLFLDEMMKGEGVIYARYVDDVKIYGDTRTKLQRLLLKVETLLKRRGLSLNSQKTKIKGIERASNTQNKLSPKKLTLYMLQSGICKLANIQSSDERVYDDEGELWRAVTPPDQRALTLCAEFYHRFRHKRATLPAHTEVMSALLLLLERYPWRSYNFCQALSLFSGEERVKTELLRLSEDLGHYEQVQHYIFETLAISQRFTIYELSQMLERLPTLTWYAKRSMYFLLLMHCRDQAFFQSIEVNAQRETHPMLSKELALLLRAWRDQESLLDRYSRINNMGQERPFIHESLLEVLEYRNTLQSIVHRPSRHWITPRLSRSTTEISETRDAHEESGSPTSSPTRRPKRDVTNDVITRGLLKLRKAQDESHIYLRMREALQDKLRSAYPDQDTSLSGPEGAESGDVWIGGARHTFLLLRAKLRYDLPQIERELSRADDESSQADLFADHVKPHKEAHDQRQGQLFVVTNLIEPRLKRLLDSLWSSRYQALKWMDCAGNHNWGERDESISLPSHDADLADLLRPSHVRILLKLRWHNRSLRERAHPFTQSHLAKTLGLGNSRVNELLDQLIEIGLAEKEGMTPYLEPKQRRAFNQFWRLLKGYLTY